MRFLLNLSVPRLRSVDEIQSPAETPTNLFRGHEGHGQPPVQQLFQPVLNGFRRDGRIKAGGSFPDAVRQNDIALAGAARAVVQILRVLCVTDEG